MLHSIETARTPSQSGDRAPNFDRVARIYRWAEYAVLGPLLQRTRTHFLHELHHRRKALVLGDGDGRFTAELLSTVQDIHILAVDTSGVMLSILRARCLRRESRSTMARLRTLQASGLEIHATRDTDLVVTHFLLDCFTQHEVDTLAYRFAEELSPGALWLVSDFGEPAKKWQRPFAAFFVRALYLAFQLTTGLAVRHLPDPQRALAGAGFALRARSSRLGGLLYTELWELQRTSSRASAAHPAAGAHPGKNASKPTESMSREAKTNPIPDALPRAPLDAQSDPEPPVPPLAEPDPGVFHHNPAPLREPEKGGQR